jgi:adenylate cyclase
MQENNTVAIEIERKFLVLRNLWFPPGRGTQYKQGYLSTDPARSVRVRHSGDAAFLTIKGPQSHGACAEFEYEIPESDALEMLNTLCLASLIEKVRYRVLVGNHWWDVDEFLGANTGLLLAEIELSHQHERFEIPAWIGTEVTGDARYFNASLCRNPYGTWTRD